MSIASLALHAGNTLFEVGYAVSEVTQTQVIVTAVALTAIAAISFCVSSSSQTISNKHAESLALPITPPEDQIEVLTPEEAKEAVENELKGVIESVTVYDLNKLDEEPPIRDKIKEYNLQLRQHEALSIRLDNLLNLHAGNPAMLTAIREKAAVVRDEYNLISAEKIMYVKENVSKDNQVYALANPRRLGPGLEVYSAQTPEKVKRMLFEEGFQNYAVGNTSKATGYAWGFQDEVDEMGDVGDYYSLGAPTYLTQDKVAVKCRTKGTLIGASIMSITELKAVGFTADQIEQGYKRIQNDFPFLQNDGLPPKDSEVVFLRPEGYLEPVELLEGDSGYAINWRGSFQSYYDRHHDSQKAPGLHPTWTSMPAVQLNAQNEKKSSHENQKGNWWGNDGWNQSSQSGNGWQNSGWNQNSQNSNGWNENRWNQSSQSGNSWQNSGWNQGSQHSNWWHNGD
ncbi:hypothetical protein [Simkania sp.]|uniref:hypothetical protein n=1 Tax=Simkania sp. TaxID=34094 RepID=UPI003B521B12